MRLESLLVLIVLFTANVSAQSYYADVKIDLDLTGYASVSGSTNHPQLETSGTNNWTSKKGGVWLFNLTLPSDDTFSDYIYEIDLPPGSSVNYVRSNGEFRISSSEDRIQITGIGEDEALEVVIQYTIDAAGEKGLGIEVLILSLLALILASVSINYLGKRKKRPRPKGEIKPPETLKTEVLEEIDTSSLSDRQKEIYNLLKEVKRPVNQSFICEKLDLPKSSVSRNIDSLERKGLVTKIRDGMSTLVSLKKK